MTEKKTVNLTFDYELFLGDNYTSAQEVLVNPTNTLLNDLHTYDIKATFFIDLTYLLRIEDTLHSDSITTTPEKAHTLENEHQSVRSNIEKILQHGHEIGIHMHPQWVDATYSDGKWRFTSFDNYALHNLSEESRRTLFSRGLRLFDELHNNAGAITPENKCFRAGGWCIHPFDQLAPLFKQYGICIDSSVTVPFFKTPYFSDQPIPRPAYNLRHLDYWKFTKDPLIPDPTGDFIEIPIDTSKTGLYDLIATVPYKPAHPWQSRGSYVKGFTGIRKKIEQLKKICMLGEYTMLTLDVDNPEFRYTQLKKHIMNYPKRRGFTFISHPKQYSKSSQTMLKLLATDPDIRFMILSDYALQLPL